MSPISSKNVGKTEETGYSDSAAYENTYGKNYPEVTSVSELTEMLTDTNGEIPSYYVTVFTGSQTKQDVFKKLGLTVPTEQIYSPEKFVSFPEHFSPIRLPGWRFLIDQTDISQDMLAILTCKLLGATVQKNERDSIVVTDTTACCAGYDERGMRYTNALDSEMSLFERHGVIKRFFTTKRGTCLEVSSGYILADSAGNVKRQTHFLISVPLTDELYLQILKSQDNLPCVIDLGEPDILSTATLIRVAVVDSSEPKPKIRVVNLRKSDEIIGEMVKVVHGASPLAIRLLGIVPKPEVKVNKWDKLATFIAISLMTSQKIQHTGIEITESGFNLYKSLVILMLMTENFPKDFLTNGEYQKLQHLILWEIEEINSTRIGNPPDYLKNFPVLGRQRIDDLLLIYMLKVFNSAIPIVAGSVDTAKELYNKAGDEFVYALAIAGRETGVAVLESCKSVLLRLRQLRTNHKSTKILMDAFVDCTLWLDEELQRNRIEEILLHKLTSGAGDISSLASQSSFHSPDRS